MSNPIQVWRKAKTSYQNLDKVGRIISLTKISSPIEGFENQRPYWVAVIKLRNGLKITSQLVEGINQPKVGDQVIGVLRRTRVPDKESIIEYGVKWKII